VNDQKILASRGSFLYLNKRASEQSNASHPLACMSRQVPSLRCNYSRCATASGRWILSILAICITTAASWIVLVEDHKPVRANDESLNGFHDEKSRAGRSEFLANEQSSESLRSRASRAGANSVPSDLKSGLPLQTRPRREHI
jgi:hypothetical protein